MSSIGDILLQIKWLLFWIGMSQVILCNNDLDIVTSNDFLVWIPAWA